MHTDEEPQQNFLMKTTKICSHPWESSFHKKQELIWCSRDTNLPHIISCVVDWITVSNEKKKTNVEILLKEKCNSHIVFCFKDIHYICSSLISLKVEKFKNWKTFQNWRACQFFTWREYVKLIFIVWKDEVPEKIPCQSLLI